MDTSMIAYIGVIPKIGTQKRRIMDTLSTPMTAGELHQRLNGGQHTTVRRRLLDLYDAGLVTDEDHEPRVCRVTGSIQKVWSLIPAERYTGPRPDTHCQTCGQKLSRNRHVE